MAKERRSLLSSQARIQVPWIKVIIGDYTFGVFSKSEANTKNTNGFYTFAGKDFNLKYPNYIQSLNITKINGQVNQYTLSIVYPVTQYDDPNFFEKVFSSVSNTRKIVFSYGDASIPSYVYKNEEAIITKIGQTFNLAGSTITYAVEATSIGALGQSTCRTFTARNEKPSDVIKELFNNKSTGLQSLFTGMNSSNLSTLIAGGDKKVKILGKQNISVLDYITYLVSCMIPEGTPINSISKDIYILTIHDESTIDAEFNSTSVAKNTDETELIGPYFKVSRTSYAIEQADAYEIDIGYNTRTIVSNFSIQNNANYSIYYDYQNKLTPEQYVRRLNKKGEWEDIYAPSISSLNSQHQTNASDTTWWTKITKYPITASITIQGLLRPATLMQYLRLNIIFPGGRKHISSGLYIVTKQQDQIDMNGYKTTLELTKVGGDTDNETTIIE